jgi:catalase (peroxidase I)
MAARPARRTAPVTRSWWGPEPEAGTMEDMGFGWINKLGGDHGVHTTTSGIEGAWKPNPTTWDMGYFTTLTDAASFAVLEPEADGFRNWRKTAYRVSPEAMLVDKAQLLTLRRGAARRSCRSSGLVFLSSSSA